MFCPSGKILKEYLIKDDFKIIGISEAVTENVKTFPVNIINQMQKKYYKFRIQLYDKELC